CVFRGFSCHFRISVCGLKSPGIVCDIVTVLYARNEAAYVHFHLHLLPFAQTINRLGFQNLECGVKPCSEEIN
ncbi:hypothetical protein, partial [Virgibacillus alimentarius]|uniref:hypothetical protein n=1 Tax=Virgibacillus alimentarius TaxID=698769 RepID=UPI000571A967